MVIFQFANCKRLPEGNFSRLPELFPLRYFETCILTSGMQESQEPGHLSDNGRVKKNQMGAPQARWMVYIGKIP